MFLNFVGCYYSIDFIWFYGIIMLVVVLNLVYWMFDEMLCFESLLEVY